MKNNASISLKTVHPHDRGEMNHVMLTKLEEHWECVDSSITPDLNNISQGHAQAIFIIGEQEERIVGTGVLVPKSTDTAEIIQMSVSSDMCWSSVGTVILHRLCEESIQHGFSHIMLETRTIWNDMIAFFEHFGFHLTREEGLASGYNRCFVLDLT
ncbi:MAG: GNAT family N-acetyltransferase [Chloroflexota bacterium]